MAKQDQIPVTQYVAKYQADAPKSQQDTWLTSIAGFCNGAQSLKLNGDVSAVRIGALVHAEGSITVGPGAETAYLPVTPRNTGFVACCAEDGTLRSAKFTAGSKELDLGGFSEGKYLINVSYFADVKEH